MTSSDPVAGNEKSKAKDVGVSPTVSETHDATAEKVNTVLTPPEPSADIDGGGRAWLQVLGSFLVFSNLWGFTFAFGSFQSYFELTYLTSQSASNISWIGTVQVFLLIVGGTISGPFFDRGYFRTMLFVGAGLETFGVFMTSLGSQYYQLFLAQGVLMGLGCGLLYIPGLALVGRSFKKHRAIAMAITSCGAPAGGVIYTLTFERLIDVMSFGWTVRIMGFVMLGTYCISFPLLLFRARNVGNLASGTKRRLIDLRAFNDLPFCWYTGANFLIFVGYMIPFNFMASYGQQALGMSRSFSLYVIMIAQASSIIGRLIAGQTASRIGVMIPWITCALAAGICCLAWIGVQGVGSFIAYASLYGCFSGALIPLPPSVFPIVCPDPKVLGARLGMAQGIGAFASLIGSPIGGALIRTTAGGDVDFLGLQVFSGVAELIGGCNLIGLWLLLIKRRGRGKFF